MSAMLLVLVTVASAFAQSKSVETFQFEKKENSHLARVVFRTRLFTRARHRSSRVAQGQTMVDGRPAIGTDGNLPGVEIASMRFYLDGQEIKVPRRLYEDCFEPKFDDEYVRMEFVGGFAGVDVSMSGSDGAGAYQVIWKLRKDGRHERLIIPGN